MTIALSLAIALLLLAGCGQAPATVQNWAAPAPEPSDMAQEPSMPPPNIPVEEPNQAAPDTDAQAPDPPAPQAARPALKREDVKTSNQRPRLPPTASPQ